MVLIDTHCHLDAPEFQHDLSAIRGLARQAGVRHCVIPAVSTSNFDIVASLAHTHCDSYALGIHPMWVQSAPKDALEELERQLRLRIDDPRLVAVGEIGLDHFVPSLKSESMRLRQWDMYLAQLRLAKKYSLPVLLHVRSSIDLVLKGLTQVHLNPDSGIGIAHAFNGSDQQAQRCIDVGLKLGFGGAFTFDRAKALRHLASSLPLSALVLETDSPDIPPRWLYVDANARAQGFTQERNTPVQLPAIGQILANLRGIDLQTLANASTANACLALPKLGSLLSDRYVQTMGI